MLPSITKLFLSVSTVTYFLLCIGITAALVIKETLISNKKAKLIINIVAATVASAFIFIYALAFIIPMINLIIKLQTD